MTDLDVRVQAQALQLAEHGLKIVEAEKSIAAMNPLVQQLTEVKGTITTMEREVAKLVDRTEKRTEADREALESKATEDREAYASQKRLVWTLGVTLFIGLAGILTAILSGTGHA